MTESEKPTDILPEVVGFMEGLGNRRLALDEAVPIEGHPFKANQNAVSAAAYVKGAFVERGFGGALMITGPMASGKTTFFGVVSQRLEKDGVPFFVFQHTFDASRNGKKKYLWVQAGEAGVESGIRAREYSEVSQLWSALQGFDQIPRVVLIDEFMFAGGGDPPFDDPEIMRKMELWARHHGVLLVFSGLNADFRGELWPNSRYVMENLATEVIELHGWCVADGCDNSSVCTQRFVRLGDGVVRPSHSNEAVVRPGSVLGKADDYAAVCPECHVVWTPEKAREFDFEHGGINMDDYSDL